MLGLQGTMAAQWEKIIWTMKNAGIFKTEDRDKIIWQVKKGQPNVLVSDIYLSLIELNRVCAQEPFPYSFWKSGCPIKIILFSWLVYNNKNLTWTNLQKRKWQGPVICIICLSNTEDNMHIFLSCPLSQILWKQMASVFGFSVVNHPTIVEAYKWWASQKSVWHPIPLIVNWFIWKWRNKKIFQNNKENFGQLFDKIIPYYSLILPIIPLQKMQRKTVTDSSQLLMPRAHFDGAAKDRKCACGVDICLSRDLQYYMYWNGGKGTNNNAEAMALHGLLTFCSFMDIDPINIYEDSKIIIDLVKGNNNNKNDNLAGWIARIKSLWRPTQFPITRIKRGQNEQADKL